LGTDFRIAAAVLGRGRARLFLTTCQDENSEVVNADPASGAPLSLSMNRCEKGEDPPARSMRRLKAKAEALGRDHLELASRAEDMRAAAALEYIIDALITWDGESLDSTTKVR